MKKMTNIFPFFAYTMEWNVKNSVFSFNFLGKGIFNLLWKKNNLCVRFKKEIGENGDQATTRCTVTMASDTQWPNGFIKMK